MVKPALIKLIAALCLTIQVWAGDSGARPMICLRTLFMDCHAPAAAMKSCCKREHPAPAAPREKCPPSCGCCVSVPPTDRSTPLQIRLDLDRAVAFASTLYCTGFVPAFELAPSAFRAGMPPPDRPDSALCLASTRLLI